MSGVPVPRIFPLFFNDSCHDVSSSYFPIDFLVIFSYSLWLYVMVIRYGRPAQIRYSSFPCAEHSDEPLKPEIVCAIELHDF